MFGMGTGVTPSLESPRKNCAAITGYLKDQTTNDIASNLIVTNEFKFQERSVKARERFTDRAFLN